MGLVLEWANLGEILLPVLIAVTTAAFLALPLRRAAEQSGLPRIREPCRGCAAEPFLLERGYCREVCTVNSAAPVGLLLFVGTATTAIFAYLDPADFLRLVLPATPGMPAGATLLLDTVVASNAAASLLVGAFFGQDLPAYRRGLLEGSAALALGLMTVGEAMPTPAFRWVELLLPLSLSAVVLGVAVEWRARYGRPAFGLRTLAVAALPMFLVSVLASARIVQILIVGLG
ncbi:MAG TPA: hypothetical protein VMH90_07210 [Thermoplasmata archaeon]|nr:hypothetical protein [Thermoplasmata archaeon]